MLMLSHNTVPAERERGCRFAEKFAGAADVLRNGGAIVGAPTWRPGGGVVLGGVADKVTYPEVKLVKSIAFRIKLDTTTEDVIKLSASHSITVSGGTISATGLTAPTIYVNGVATATITTDEAHVTITTATAFDADDFQVGYVSSFGGFTIRELKLFTEALSTSEALDYAENSTFSYRGLADHDFLCDMAHHDPTNKLALDSSAAGDDATLGDGAGTGEPTKTTEGYEFDGADDYFSGLDAPTGTYTVSVFKRVSGLLSVTHENDLTTWNQIVASGGFTGTLLGLRTYRFALSEMQQLDETADFYRSLGRV